MTLQTHDFALEHAKQGLYAPNHEHDACGVGFVANIKGRSVLTIDTSVRRADIERALY